MYCDSTNFRETRIPGVRLFSLNNLMDTSAKNERITRSSKGENRICQIRRYIYPLNYALLALVLLAFHRITAAYIVKGHSDWHIQYLGTTSYMPHEHMANARR